MTETVWSPETSANLYRTTRHYNVEDRNLPSTAERASNPKIDIRGADCEAAASIACAQGRTHWRAVVNLAMHVQFPQKVEVIILTK
jgi:hypothetical protein